MPIRARTAAAIILAAAASASAQTPPATQTGIIRDPLKYVTLIADGQKAPKTIR